MYIAQDIALKDFQYWCGAKNFAERLTDHEFSIIEEYLIDYYDGIIPKKTDINDVFWFDDRMLIEDILQYDYDEFWKRKPIRGEGQ